MPRSYSTKLASGRFATPDTCDLEVEWYQFRSGARAHDDTQNLGLNLALTSTYLPKRDAAYSRLLERPVT